MRDQQSVSGAVASSNRLPPVARAAQFYVEQRTVGSEQDQTGCSRAAQSGRIGSQLNAGRLRKLTLELTSSLDFERF